MNNKEFIADLARRTNLTAEQTQKIVRTLISEMGQQFEEGNNISIPNFGTFELRKRLERILNHPVTGQKMLVPPKIVLQFKPTTTIKQRLKSGGDDNGKE